MDTGFSARSVAALDSVAPRADAASDSREMWRALGRNGVLAALFAGSPGDRSRPHTPSLEYMGALLAALDARYPIGIVLSACVQIATALPILREYADRGPVAAAFESAISGQAVLALAATDGAGSGSDLMSLDTTATLSSEQVVVDGEKRWITNACTAKYALVLARHRPQRHFTSFLWVLVPTDAPGVQTAREDSALFAGSGVGRISCRQVVLGRDHVVGPPGRGLATFARHVATERLAGGLWATSMCRRVLASTHRQLSVRRLGEAVMWDNAAIRQRFARCLVEAWRMEAACQSFCADFGGRDALVSSMLLKTAISDGLDLVLAECAQLVGAEAFAQDGIAQLRTEAGMFGIAGGAGGAMLAGIADHATDLLQRCG